MTLPPTQRRHARSQLVLKVEFDDAAGFRSNYLSDLSEGGVRIHTTMEVGQRILLNISFLGFVEPIQI
ncbi:MAG: PilZ domain-containing protein, partial [Deltaproteobacteria bacterium]|nr:PilZ domain-containing protein [Deltaproteobacteria bacterium]